MQRLFLTENEIVSSKYQCLKLFKEGTAGRQKIDFSGIMKCLEWKLFQSHNLNEIWKKLSKKTAF